MKTIRYKSTPENWKKEDLDIKSNTVRIAQIGDIRSDLLDAFALGTLTRLNLELEETVNHDITTKKVKDVTVFWVKNETKLHIISW